MAGRSGQVYTDWIAEREQQWREQIRIAALDPYRGYTTALATTLPEATRVLDAFHIATLANKIVNETGQRIQQATLGHRGRKGDPLYEIRRLLHRGIETLSDAQRRQVNLGLQVSHPPSAVTVAWATAQQLRSLSHPPPRPSAELGRSPRSPRCRAAQHPRWPTSTAPSEPGAPNYLPTSTPPAPATDRPKRSTC